MRKVVVLGVGMTRFGVHTKTCVELFSEAALEAIEKSNLEPKDIGALFLGNCLGGFEEGQAHMAPFVHSAIGLKNSAPGIRFECACASGTAAVRNAALLVGAGVYDIALAGGVERTTAMTTPLATRTFAMASHAQYETPTGITFPGVFAMAAHMYADKYKIPIKELKRNMAEVSVKNHYNGSKNKKAHFQKEISVEKVLSGVKIADPLQMLDCCPFSDGAAAVIVASADKAKDLIKKPIYIEGMGQASAGPLYIQQDLTRIIAREISSNAAYKEAGVSPSDIDVCELHDCFTIAEILAIESLGFYEFGKGFDAAAKKETYIGGGSIAINSSGGLKAKGHPIGATGAAQVIEIVEQLREESGERQVDGAKIGLVDTLGGDFGTVCNIILRS